MPWNNGPSDGGSGNRGSSPWGDLGGGGSGRNNGPRNSGPGGGWGGGGPRGPNGVPPDLDELIARIQAFLRGLLPGGRGRGMGGGRGLVLIIAALIVIWLGTGFYRVQPDEQGVVLRFGAYSRTTLPGLNYHIPWPVETVELPAVTRINRVEVGYRSGGDAARAASGRDVALRDVPEESLMLTGDENIVDINFAVFWRIRDASAYLFNTRNPGSTVKAVSESVMREVIGRTPIQPALTDARAQIEAQVFQGVQTILDQYGTGVEITQVQLQKVDPPGAVIDSFRDVQRATTDAERMRNEADAYRNDIVPRARGDAARIIAEASGARQAAIAQSTGEGQRFLSVLTAYRAAKDITLQRLYIETMEGVLRSTPSVIVDDKLQGIVPYLPLGDTGRPAAPAAPRAPAAPSASTQTSQFLPPTLQNQP
ncbi:MAG TPA: FtsH protease activity modulator HflK [Acetobacteraceae bacterium]|nr:FtsH protease activity modulator HflK [Acetobacteraceae bacterium]